MRRGDYVTVKCPGNGRGSGGRPRHREYAFDHGVFVVAAAGDRPHGGRVQLAIPDKPVVDMHADDLSEHDMAVERPADVPGQQVGLGPEEDDRPVGLCAAAGRRAAGAGVEGLRRLQGLRASAAAGLQGVSVN